MDFIPSPNRRKRTVPITAIVIHYTGANTLASTIDWFKRPESQVSAHYVIDRAGRVVQMVLDTDVAWHAGRSTLAGQANVNSFSLGIELVGTADSGFTDPQLNALDALIARLVRLYRIPPDRIVGHRDIAPGRKIDPDGYRNQFDWTRTRQVAAAALAHGGPDV